MDVDVRPSPAQQCSSGDRRAGFVDRSVAVCRRLILAHGVAADREDRCSSGAATAMPLLRARVGEGLRSAVPRRARPDDPRRARRRALRRDLPPRRPPEGAGARSEGAARLASVPGDDARPLAVRRRQAARRGGGEDRARSRCIGPTARVGEAPDLEPLDAEGGLRPCRCRPRAAEAERVPGVEGRRRPARASPSRRRASRSSTVSRSRTRAAVALDRGCSRERPRAGLLRARVLAAFADAADVHPPHRGDRSRAAMDGLRAARAGRAGRVRDRASYAGSWVGAFGDPEQPGEGDAARRVVESEVTAGARSRRGAALGHSASAGLRAGVRPGRASGRAARAGRGARRRAWRGLQGARRRPVRGPTRSRSGMGATAIAKMGDIDAASQ